jgi:uncharacterized protein (DUF1810 family)
MADPYNLQRFVAAQASCYESALGEIAQGRKTSHWMWFIFPQLHGLGSSEMSRRYAIGSLDEAAAYLAHPLLGPRLRACVAALQNLLEADAEAVFGAVDAAKLRSSLTLFVRAGGGWPFEAALHRWFGGQSEQRTLQILAASEQRL